MRRLVFFIAAIVLVAARGASADQTTATPAAAVIHVQVLGAVLRPGVCSLVVGSRLSDALAAAGAMPAAKAGVDGDIATVVGRADLRRVFLTRVVDGTSWSYSIDTTGRLSDAAYDPVLQTGDKIYVPAWRLQPQVIATTSV